MTTGLSDESGVDADDTDFDWDVFKPDVDEAGPDEVDALADADEAEAEVDDSDLDWEAALEAEDTLGAHSGAVAPPVGDPGTEADDVEADDVEPDWEAGLDAEDDGGAENAEDAAFTGAGIAPEVGDPDMDDAEPDWDVGLGAEEDAADDRVDVDAAFDRMEENVRLADLPPAPPPVPVRSRAYDRSRKKANPAPSSRIKVAAAVMVVILLVLVIAAALVQPPRAKPSDGTPTTPPTARASTDADHEQTTRASADADHVQTATDEVDSATTAALSGLAAIQGYPTPAKVATVITPYVSSLQLYETLLSGSSVPPAARDGDERHPHPGAPAHPVPQHGERTARDQPRILPEPVRQRRRRAAVDARHARAGPAHAVQGLSRSRIGLGLPRRLATSHTGASPPPTPPLRPPTRTPWSSLSPRRGWRGGLGEVPVGAVTLIGGQVVAARHNERERTGDPTAHAEMLALRDTAAALGGWRLPDVTLVVTLEPCPMCAGALVAARVGRVVYGASDPRAGACGTLYNLCADPRLNHELRVTRGVRADECGDLLTAFFAEKRSGRTALASGPAARDPA